MSITEQYEEDQLLKGQRLIETGQYWDALMAANEALLLNPLNATALFLAGMALYRGAAHGAALPILNAAAKIDGRWQTWNNIGCCLQERHPEDAYVAFKKAHEIDPKAAAPMSNLCSMASNLGRHEEALAWAAASLKIDPTNKEAVYNASLSMLALGRWAEGWTRYAVSMPSKNRQERFFDRDHVLPRWDGRPGVKVVLYGEQGIGDEILFASMVPDALKSGAEILIETDPRLAGLWRRSFPDAKVYDTRWEVYCEWPEDERPQFKMELGGLGQLYAPEPFRRGAFLVPDAQKRVMARAWLDSVCKPGALRVGIAWTAGAWHTGRAERSLLPDWLSPILGASGVDFVCLEYEDPTRAIEKLGRPIHDQRAFVQKGADYDMAAALVSELDLVIAPTTSVVDLAGALGRPCWVLVNAASQWRYSDRAGADEMWFYESVTTYRQKVAGQWGAPVAKAARELRELTGQRKAAA